METETCAGCTYQFDRLDLCLCVRDELCCRWCSAQHQAEDAAEEAGDVGGATWH